MNSAGLQQNFILFLENTAKEPHQPPGRRLCCEKCRFSTKDTELFERHVAHHEEVTFSCTLCNHVSYSRVESQRHIVKHKGSFPYKCSWCPYGAVRRDYMVKHIQRIHGKTADGSFITDCSLSATKMEPHSQTGIKDLSMGLPRTSGGPLHDVRLVSHSGGVISSLFPGVGQTKHTAPSLVAKTVQQQLRNQVCSTTAQSVTSTSCSLPVPKTLPSAIHTVSKGTHGVNNSPKIVVTEVGQTVVKTIPHIKKMTDKPSLEPVIPLTSALPRIHVGICGDRIFQQKPLFQSPLGGTIDKTGIHSKTVPKIQVALPGGNNNHLKSVFSDLLESPAAQKTVLSGEVRSIPVVHSLPRSVPSSSTTNNPAERFGQVTAPSITHGANVPEKTSQQKTRPNILVMPPSNKLQPKGRSNVQKELLPSIHRPSQPSKPSTASCLEERYHPGSNVQVELLSPLNQPIQHNKPLTVSCPEEINIPAGCLVELVEVKNVNGTRELELRLVPQQLTGPQLGDLRSPTAAATTDRMSFKCRVAPDDNQPTNMNHGIGSMKTTALPELLVKRSELQKPLTNIKVTVKNEPEVNGLFFDKNVLQLPGSSSKCLQSLSRPILSHPTESNKVTQQLCSDKKAANGIEPLNLYKQFHFTGKSTSHAARNENITPKGLKYELRAAKTSLNKDTEGHFNGLPVISSVFSLCPIPQETLKHIQIREEILNRPVEKPQIPSDSGPAERAKNAQDSGVYKLDLKTEEETSLSTEKVKKCGQPNQKDEPFDDTKASESKVPGKRDDMRTSYQAFANNQSNMTPNRCSFSAAAPDQVSSGIISLSNQSNDSTLQPENKRSLPLEDNLPAQKVNILSLSMNPTVALVRIPSLESITLSDSVQKAPEKADAEESITARPVLCCTSNQQNVHERSIKLVLKRKQSETETMDCTGEPQLGLAYVDIQPMYKKVKKSKKRNKKSKSSKVQQILEEGQMENLFLMPLKEDQLVKRPGPNQPVVVLNHPRPLVNMVSVGVQNLSDQGCTNTVHDLYPQNETTPCQSEGQVPSFKMKLKKVQGQKYEVTELVLKGVSEKMVLGQVSNSALHHCL